MSDIKERLRNGVNIGSAEGFQTKAVKWSDAQEAADFIETLEIKIDEEIARNEKLGLLAERLKEELEKHKWQPIETAPKDGTEILVRSEEINEPSIYNQYVSVASWSKKHNCFMYRDHRTVGHKHLTQWKPLEKPE